MYRLAAIVASSDDAIIGKDLQGIVTNWNKGAERIFGYLAEEIIGKSIKLLIPTEYHSEEDTILGACDAENGLTITKLCGNASTASFSMFR